MKKLVIAAIIGAGLLSIPRHIYPQTLIALDHTTAETAAGYRYTIPDPDDIIQGDVIACIMFDHGTAGIQDDTIITWRYAGCR